MKKSAVGFASALALLAIGSAASANEVFQVWGTDTTTEQARNDARSQGRQLCLNAGYSFGAYEEVNSYGTGSVRHSYGLVQCF